MHLPIHSSSEVDRIRKNYKGFCGGKLFGAIGASPAASLQTNVLISDQGSILISDRLLLSFEKPELLNDVSYCVIMTTMRLLYHPHKKDLSLAGVLYALGDPVRLEIVKQLAAKGELPCCATLALPVAKSTLSHHFKVLRESGVLHSRKEGTQHMNSLRREDLDDRFPGLLAVVLQEVQVTD